MKRTIAGFATLGLVFGVFGVVEGWLVRPAQAQQVIYSNPVAATSLGGDASGTITVTNTFQKLWGAANGSLAPVPGATATRKGCSIENNGTHNMFVNEGTAIGSATTSNTWIVAAGALFNCNFSGVVLTGEIDITGTGGDAFVAKQF